MTLAEGWSSEWGEISQYATLMADGKRLDAFQARQPSSFVRVFAQFPCTCQRAAD